MEHPKSKLFEIIASKKYDSLKLCVPTFTFKQNLVKESNSCEFVCTAEIMVNNIRYPFYSDTHSTKKNSEREVCSMILLLIEQLSETRKPFQKKIILGHDTTIIVDYENVSKKSEIDKLYKFVKTIELDGFCINVVKIAGYMSSVKNNTDIVVRSSHKDAVDHYISFYTGRLYEKLVRDNEELLHKIVIISRDHFSTCIQDFCPIVLQASDVDDFINIAEKGF